MSNMFIENYNTDVSAFLENRKALKGREREMYYLRYGDMLRLAKERYGDNIDISVLTSSIYDKDGTEIKNVPYFQCHEGNFGYVKTKVSALYTEGKNQSTMVQTCILPIMDSNFNSIPLDKITSADIDDSIQRCKVKNVAMATGLGLCLYRGKIRDKIEGVELTEKDKQEMKDNFFMWCYKQNPLKLNKDNSRTVLGGRYVSWADDLLALKTLFPYATFSVDMDNQFKYEGDNILYNDTLPYKRRGNGEIVSSVRIVIPLPPDEKGEREFKIVSGERRVLDATRMHTVNLNNPTYNYKGKEVNVDYGFAVNSGIQRAFCKTLAENTGLYLNYYMKEQEDERIAQNEESEKTDIPPYEQWGNNKIAQEKENYLFLKDILSKYYHKEIPKVMSDDMVGKQLSDVLTLCKVQGIDLTKVSKEDYMELPQSQKRTFINLVKRLNNVNANER